MTSAVARALGFCNRFGIDVPILLAPMAGACPPSLSIAVASAGGMGAAGLLRHEPRAIAAWMREFRAGSAGAVQLNLWVPDPPPVRDAARERELREFLAGWGPEVPAEAGDVTLHDFDAQFTAMLAAKPTAISSIMGLYDTAHVAELKSAAIAWFASVSTVAEAVAAEEAGADVIVAQGAEAGGHRAAFKASAAERQLVGLFSLLPAVVDAVRVPVVAAGGIADGRGVAAALALGASAVQVGTAFLRSPEANLHPAWADALGKTRPEDTLLTRAFTGRAARSIANDYAIAASAGSAPPAAPYPVQAGLTAPMRTEALAAGDIVRRLWAEARRLLAVA